MARIVLCGTLALSVLAGMANAQTTQWVFYAEPPVLQYMPEALYPCKALRQRVEGTVRVQALIDKDGRVQRVHIVQSVPLLDEEAKCIVQESRWLPARNKQREPVVVWVKIPVRFSLDAFAPPPIGAPDDCSETADRLWRSGVYNEPKPLAKGFRYDGADFADFPHDSVPQDSTSQHRVKGKK